MCSALSALRPLIVGIEGNSLGAQEAANLRATNPFGVILFSRNIASPDQLKTLVAALRAEVRQDLRIMVDAEGGRVWRFPDTFGSRPPAPATYGQMAEEQGLEKAGQACEQGFAGIGSLFQTYGLDIDGAPCLDVLFPGASSVIGDRSFSDDPALVADLGGRAVQGLRQEGIVPVIKHMVGHGRATKDSHKALPVVNASAAELEKTDMLPFKQCAPIENAWGMTAHIIYTALDDKNAATFSATIITDYIRGAIGFKGILMSDDLAMGAATEVYPDPKERVHAALSAGCDLALLCHGGSAFYKDIAASIDPVSQETYARLNAPWQQ